MDSQFVISNSSNSNIEMASNNISMVFPNRAQFYSSCQLQNFSMPDNIIFYISKNPSTSKFYQKITQSCKYFFIKNPIIVVQELCYTEKNWYTRGSRPSKDRPNYRSIYLNEITNQLWITDSFSVWGDTPKCPVVTFFTPKIYQCDAAYIFIDEQKFSFNNFMVIASKCELIRLSCVVIMNNDAIVPEIEYNYFKNAALLEAIFKALPNVKSFTYYLPNNSSNIITTKTAEELLEIPNFLRLDKFEISEIPEVFDIQSFFGHIKENKKTRIDLDFSSPISLEYQTQLQKIVGEILATKNHSYKVPLISFPGFIQYKILKGLYNLTV